jgi:hypothetical protein
MDKLLQLRRQPIIGGLCHNDYPIKDRETSLAATNGHCKAFRVPSLQIARKPKKRIAFLPSRMVTADERLQHQIGSLDAKCWP